MRLTLRTLLAYRDRVLEPKDAEILEQRLRESQAARTISDRISNLISHPGLTPLEIDATEFGEDPNDVACFLDDTMATERVADMERRCLDHNGLLADVATCHHVLVQVLRSPATQAPPRLRQRVAELWGADRKGRRVRGDAPHAGPPSPFGVVARDRHTVRLEHPGLPLRRPTVPDYLQTPERRWIGPALRIVVLIVFFSVCVAMALGSREQLRAMLDPETSDWSSVSTGTRSLERDGR